MNQVDTFSAAPAASIPLLALRGVSKKYRMGAVEVPVLHTVDLEVFPGEITVMVGPSGSGKSTLLNIVGGIDTATDGQVWFSGEDISGYSARQLTEYRREKIGFVFQFYNLVPTLNAEENVIASTEISKSPIDAIDALKLVGLGHRLDHFPSQMSGGEQQRVAIARAVAKNPELLLCDEPTGALDLTTGRMVLGTLVELNESLGVTIIIITHNEAIAGIGHRLVRIGSGTIARVVENTERILSRRDYVVSILDRKLRRELYAAKGRLAGVVVIIALGIAVFVLYQTLYLNLESSRQGSYSDCRMADFWVNAEKVPLFEIEQLLDVSGVSELRPCITRHLVVDLDSVEKPLTGKLVSMPADPRPVINNIVVRSGSYFSGLRRAEVIVGDGFARARNLRPGDRLHVFLNQRRQELVVVGTAISAPYSFPAAPGSLIPDKAGYAILYVTEEFAEEALELQGAANEIVGLLAPEYKQRPGPVLQEIKRRLKPYGQATTTSLDRQPSHIRLSTAIRSYRVMSIIAPLAFLGAAAMILDILMQRMAQQQRTVVGTLKAIGHRDSSLVGHFVKFGALVGVLGGALGACLGFWLAGLLLRLLGDFFEFTHLVHRPYPLILALGVCLSVLFSVSGTLRGAWSVLRLSPSEAMRPKPPIAARRGLLEKWRSIWKRLGFRWHMVIRGLLTQRIRVFTGFLCAMAGTMLVFFALSAQASMDQMIAFTFERMLISDLDMTFQSELDYGALLEAKMLPGVDYAEPVLRWKCTLSNGNHSRDTAITGILPAARLTVPRTHDDRLVSIPDFGVLVNQQLADALHVSVGSVLYATPKEGRQQTVSIPVAGVVKGYTGTAAYGDFRYVNKLAGEEESLNSVQTKIKPGMMPQLYQALKELPKLQGYSDMREQKLRLEDFTDQQRVAIRVMILFAGLLFGGSVLTASMVSFTERSREIATLRVLGYRLNEIGAIFVRESLLVNFLGIIMGLAPGYFLAKWFIASLSTEDRALPFAVQPATWAWTIGLGLLFTVLANYPVLRAIKKMDWQDALNVKE